MRAIEPNVSFGTGSVLEQSAPVKQPTCNIVFFKCFFSFCICICLYIPVYICVFVYLLNAFLSVYILLYICVKFIEWLSCSAVCSCETVSILYVFVWMYLYVFAWNLLRGWVVEQSALVKPNLKYSTTFKYYSFICICVNIFVCICVKFIERLGCWIVCSCETTNLQILKIIKLSTILSMNWKYMHGIDCYQSIS